MWLLLLGVLCMCSSDVTHCQRGMQWDWALPRALPAQLEAALPAWQGMILPAEEEAALAAPRKPAPWNDPSRYVLLYCTATPGGWSPALPGRGIVAVKEKLFPHFGLVDDRS